MDDHFITLTEAAKRLGLSRCYVYRMARMGKFPSARKLFNRFIFIDPADLERPEVQNRPMGYPKGRPRHP